MKLEVVVLIGGGTIGLYKMRVDIPAAEHSQALRASVDSMMVRAEPIKAFIVRQYEKYFHKHDEETHPEEQQIMVTSPIAKDVIVTQQFVCQIRSRRHIDVCALENGYLKAIGVKEGQAVKKGDVMFEIIPVLYKARVGRRGGRERLRETGDGITPRSWPTKKRVSQKEVRLFKAKLAKAKAKADLAEAELNFTKVKAPFDGIIDRRARSSGSLIKEGDILTTLSDNSVMWVYFNVPEAQYLEYMASSEQEKEDRRIELELANHRQVPAGPPSALTIEGQFNNQTGNIAFRADFENPGGLLRHGQTGTILIHRTFKNAVVIPQRATFEILDKRYVWVVDEDDVAHQRLITIKHELEDIFVINSGLDVGDKIVLEGVRQIEEGKKVEYEFRKPEEALKNQKFHAE